MTTPVRTLVIFAVGVLAVSGAVSAYGQGTLLERGREFFRNLDGPPRRPARLTDTEIAAGLREALRVASERVVETLGAEDGFNRHADVRIKLPKSLARVRSTLDRFGVGGVADALELRLNRAAEAAVPRAEQLFADAIGAMKLGDVRAILAGAEDSATRYFRARMAAPLTAEMKPIVDQELANVGAIQAYDEMIRQYRSFPFVPDAKADLSAHVLERAVDGVFLYLAREEALIRKHPVKRTTTLLKRVFAGG
jgi:hypothetical protein